jgi:hypothetical protein
MTVYNAIKSMDKATLKAFIKAGLISCNTERNMQIYEKIEAYKQTENVCLTDACLMVEAHLNFKGIKERQIRNIYNSFKSEIVC